MRLSTTLVLPAVALACGSLVACSSSGPATTGSSLPGSSGSGGASQTASGASGSSGSAPTTGSHGSGRSTPSHGSGSSSAKGDPHTAAGLFAAMTEKERVGQLLMVDCPSTGVAAATVSAITQDKVGSVILDGTTSSGEAAIRSLTTSLENDNPSPAKLFISTDQEGGEVQRLTGSGFSSIPSAVDQGQVSPTALRKAAAQWGGELKAAGVNVDLAPVLDTVPADGGPNPPIGDLDREYGHTPAAVSSHGVAVAQGLADAGVDATVKHFPGLGRVAGNTDTTSNVVDSVTTRNDAYLAPFRAAVKAGVPFVMVSSAIYSKIDPGTPAVFSHTIITDMLRGDLGFTGVVITDDVGVAKQVTGYSVGDRAVKFVQAGGDMVLTVDASLAGTMTQALLAKANADPAFKKLVDAAALRVLQAKQARGLLN